MNKDSLKKAYNDYKNGTIAVTVMFDLIIQYLCNDSKDPPKCEYIPIEKFCNDYPVVSISTLNSIARLCDNPDSFAYKVSNKWYFKPAETIKHIVNNKHRFVRIYNKLKKNNFYGVEIS